MKVSSFYRSCKKSFYFDALTGTNEHIVFSEAVKMMCDLMASKPVPSMDFLLDEVKTYLFTKLSDTMFAFSWQKEQFIIDSIEKVKRFLNWLGEVEIIKSNISVSAVIDNISLEDDVSLIIKYGNTSYGALLISTGKNRFSKCGRSFHTTASNNLHSLLAKFVLEKEYPGLTITNVYLSSEEDSIGNIKNSFLINKTKKSNICSQSFREYVTEGNLCLLKDKITTVLHTPLTSSCFGCKHAALCRIKPFANKYDCIIPTEETVEKKYALPAYTDSQLEVIQHVDGPMLVCAGPGSGKTATLVGRIKKLLEKGIPSEFILVTTFSREAAKELQTRCKAFCEKDMPTICTIHSLCYQILRDNQHIIGKVNLLTKKDKLLIIENLLEAMPAITGLNYSVYEGNNGVIKTVERRLDKLITLEFDSDQFFNLYPDMSYDFIELANHYRNIIERNGFISFDEQISLCIKFLQENPDALEDYQRIYQYIMVDEYQDVDEKQANFIYMLAKHQNLVVVGDDDQAIYGFRGASHIFMMEFTNHFTAAKKVVLKENFRSTKALVHAAQEVIAENNRIEKQLTATREQGMEPAYITGTNAENVDTVISSLIEEGFTYSEIAVLSQKNATLEALHDKMSYPTVLEKSYLVNDPLFIGIYFSLKLIDSKYTDNRSMLFLCQLFGIFTENYYSENLYQTVKAMDTPESNALSNFLDNALEVLNSANPYNYIQYVAFEFALESTDAFLKLKEIVKESHLNSTHDLYVHLSHMTRFADDTKLSVDNTDSILLITNHESKGREFSAVILVDEEKDATTDEQRKVLYVAMTRAQDRLFILRN